MVLSTRTVGDGVERIQKLKEQLPIKSAQKIFSKINANLKS